jgi:hypothetical protein
MRASQERPLRAAMTGVGHNLSAEPTGTGRKELEARYETLRVGVSRKVTN